MDPGPKRVVDTRRCNAAARGEDHHDSRAAAAAAAEIATTMHPRGEVAVGRSRPAPSGVVGWGGMPQTFCGELPERVVIWSAIVFFVCLPNFFFFDDPDPLIPATLLFFGVWGIAVLVAAIGIAVPEPGPFRRGLCARVGLWAAAVGCLEASAVTVLSALAAASDYVEAYRAQEETSDTLGRFLLSSGTRILIALAGLAAFLLLARTAQARPDGSEEPPPVYVALAEVV